MSKSENQKQKLLYIAKYLMEQTDGNHSVTTPELIAYLASQGIKAERKSIYTDIACLNDFGMDIIRSNEHRGGYLLASRDFELAEVKLLVDLVQSSKFITEKKSRELIKKLEKLVSKNEAKTIQGQVVVLGRNKAINESIYYTVDMIHEAISNNLQCSFQYCEWNINKELVPRHNGSYYRVSPWNLSWADENYYLRAYDSNRGEIRTYRVDKMQNVKIDELPREGKNLFDEIPDVEYNKQTFSMFAGEKRTVRLRCKKECLGVIIDRFGNDVSIRPDGTEHIMAHMDVQVSPQFFAWVAGLGNNAMIMAPKEVELAYKEYLETILKQYEN